MTKTVRSCDTEGNPENYNEKTTAFEDYHHLDENKDILHIAFAVTVSGANLHRRRLHQTSLDPVFDKVLHSFADVSRVSGCSADEPPTKLPSAAKQARKDWDAGRLSVEELKKKHRSNEPWSHRSTPNNPSKRTSKKPPRFSFETDKNKNKKKSCYNKRKGCGDANKGERDDEQQPSDHEDMGLDLGPFYTSSDEELKDSGGGKNANAQRFEKKLQESQALSRPVFFPRKMRKQ